METSLPDKSAKPLSKYITFVVWVLRLAVGAVFIFSGFVKCIDPWGYIFKIEEYLQVWHIDWLWRETVLCLAVAISVVEFCCGFALVTGCLRRMVCWVLGLFMLVMLPLTAYIVVANPVSDCGCFGDALVISNTATFIKNIFLTAAVIFLIKYNSRVKGIYPPLSQALPMVLSMLYCLVLAFVGITIQPMVDFRPYKVGTNLIEDELSDVRLVYAKDGEEQVFTLDALPDTTWTFVRRLESNDAKEAEQRTFAIFDGDEDVTDAVIETYGPQVLLVVPDPKIHRKSRSSMANNIDEYVTTYGGNMIGIVAASPEALETWKKAAKPHFDVFTSDDTVLKELVRGDAGLVYLVDGKIVWKRNIYSLSGDFPDFTDPDNELDTVYVIDSGTPIACVTLIYIGALFIFYLLGLIRIKRDKNTRQKDFKVDEVRPNN